MKRKGFIFLFILFFTGYLPAQNAEQIDSLVTIGMEYHDEGRYDKAIATYKKVLEIDPNSAIANYEISISLVENKEYYEAIEYCYRLIDRDDRFSTLSYNTLGSCLNYLGRADEAIDVFLEGIEKYNDFYLLYYNLGLAYHTKEKYEKAKEAFITTIDLNPHHANAHLNLGRTMMDMGERIESLLSLFYFLLIEPGSEKSEWAYHAIHLQLSDKNYKKKEEKEDRSLSLFEPVDAMIAQQAILNEKEEVKGRTEMDQFIRTTTTLFKMLGDIKKQNNPTDFWWDFYVPFFVELNTWGHTDVFCHYISHLFSKTSADWLNSNASRIKDFNNWLKQL